jgi:hypothetical protein
MEIHFLHKLMWCIGLQRKKISTNFEFPRGISKCPEIQSLVFHRLLTGRPH